MQRPGDGRVGLTCLKESKKARWPQQREGGPGELLSKRGVLGGVSVAFAVSEVGATGSFCLRNDVIFNTN